MSQNSSSGIAPPVLGSYLRPWIIIITAAHIVSRKTTTDNQQILSALIILLALIFPFLLWRWEVNQSCVRDLIPFQNFVFFVNLAVTNCFSIFNLFFSFFRSRHALDVKFWRSKCTTVLVITWLVPSAESNSAGSVWKKSRTCITWVHRAALFGAKNPGRERKNFYGSWELWSELRWELLYWPASQFQLCSSEFLHGLEGKFTIISKVSQKICEMTKSRTALCDLTKISRVNHFPARPICR